MKVDFMGQISDDSGINYGSLVTNSVIAGAGWGTGQYLFNKTPFMDKAGNLPDVFVKKVEDALVAVKDKATLDNVDFQKKLEKEIDNIASMDKLKEFVAKKKDDFIHITEEDLKSYSDDLAKIDLDKAKIIVKDLFKSEGKYSKYYKETIASCYNDAKKLVYDATKISEEKFAAIKKVINQERAVSALKSAGIFTAFCILMCGITEIFVSKKATKN